MSNRRFQWTYREELMCLLIYKKLIEKNFQWGLRTKLCYDMSLKKNTPSYNSINLKVGNYECLFTKGKKGMSGGASNRKTVNAYKEFKDSFIEDIERHLKSMEK